MNLKYLNLCAFLILSLTLKGQPQNYIGSENIFDIAIYKADTNSLKKNIKTISVFYYENGKKEQLIENREFDELGKVRKIVDYTFSFPQDSIVLSVPYTDQKIYEVQTTFSSKTSIKEFISDDIELIFPHFEYKKLIDSVTKTDIYTIDKKYFLSDDSIIRVMTYVNNREVKNSALINPFKKNQILPPLTFPKVDTLFHSDTMILMSRSVQHTLSHVLKLHYLKSKLVKMESYFEDTSGRKNYQYTRWKYDHKKRLTYCEEGFENNKQVVKSLVKTISYFFEGKRTEEDDINGVDGRIDIQRKFNRKNKLTKLSNYYYQYKGNSNTLSKTVAEISYKYHFKDIISSETRYYNGILQSVKTYKYTFFKHP